jgi:hypothetical protein
MTVTLLEIIRAAAGRGAVVTADMAGYLLLGVLDELAPAPVEASVEAVCLSPDGSTRLRPGDAVPEPRALLGALLSVSVGGGAALLPIAARTPSGCLATLAGEIRSALIPLNPAAGRRALARLHREVLRAAEAGKQISVPEALSRLAPARDAEPVEPPRAPPVASAPSTEALASPATPESQVESEAGEGPGAAEGQAEMPAPDVAETSPRPDPVAPDVHRWEPLSAEHTPLFGTAMAPRAPAEPELPRPSARRESLSAQPTPPLPAPRLDPPRPRFITNERDGTPPLPWRLAAAARAVASSLSSPSAATSVAVPPLVATAVPPPVAIPVPPPVTTSASASREAAPRSAPPLTRRSAIRELLAAFSASSVQQQPEEIARDLKQLAGLDATPPPVAVSEPSGGAPESQGGKRGSGGQRLGLLIALVGFGLAAAFGARAPADAGVTPPACEATLVVSGVTPGSELRVRGLGATDEAWLQRVADAPTVELHGIPCGRPQEVVIREQAAWQRLEVPAEALEPAPGLLQVRHEMTVRAAP